jgi:hypothetical protein
MSVAHWGQTWVVTFFRPCPFHLFIRHPDHRLWLVDPNGLDSDDSNRMRVDVVWGEYGL